MLWIAPYTEKIFSGGAGPRRAFLDRIVSTFDDEHSIRISGYEKNLKQTQTNKEKKTDRRGAYVASKNRRRSKPQYLTGRSAAASGIATANREKNLQQSVGSLDRRVDKALADGNTDLAKDLRSRQNKFVKQLGLERARKIGGGTIQGNVRTSRL